MAFNSFICTTDSIYQGKRTSEIIRQEIEDLERLLQGMWKPVDPPLISEGFLKSILFQIATFFYPLQFLLYSSNRAGN